MRLRLVLLIVAVSCLKSTVASAPIVQTLYGKVTFAGKRIDLNDDKCFCLNRCKGSTPAPLKYVKDTVLFVFACP